MKKLSLCITTWKRSQMLINSFAQVLNDERVGEIVISSDADDSTEMMWLNEIAATNPKVKIVRNDTRLGVYGNKHTAVKAASLPWVIIFDSDNVMTTAYLDAIYSYTWRSDQILAPDFAMPHFDYTEFKGKVINQSTVHKFIGRPRFDCLLNTMNYFLHRPSYLDIWEPQEGIIGADSIWWNRCWIKAGGSIYVVPGLRYEHKVHDGSYFQAVAVESTPMCKAIEMELKQLR